MSKKHKKKHSEEEGGEAWLLPYSDLMTLLLAVFIVLFAVSKVDEEKAKDVANAFRKDMMTDTKGILSSEGDSVIQLYPDEVSEKNKQPESYEETKEDISSTKDSTNKPLEDNNKPQESTYTSKDNANISQEELEEFLGKYELGNLESLKSKLVDMFKNEHLTDDVTTKIDTRGLIISLNNAILFSSGSAEIKKSNEDTLIKIAKIINTLDNYIRIEGHTDNVPIYNAVYPSNWELSTARASSVVRLFIDKCNVSPDKVVAVGYGEYKPVADNSTAEGRAKNRRIDIIILSEKYNNLEK